jgi:hypothetical protein
VYGAAWRRFVAHPWAGLLCMGAPALRAAWSVRLHPCGWSGENGAGRVRWSDSWVVRSGCGREVNEVLPLRALRDPRDWEGGCEAKSLKACAAKVNGLLTSAGARLGRGAFARNGVAGPRAGEPTSSGRIDGRKPALRERAASSGRAWAGKGRHPPWRRSRAGRRRAEGEPGLPLQSARPVSSCLSWRRAMPRLQVALSSAT